MQEVAVLLIVAGLVALAVARSRNIAIRQARLARERENLGRYFPEKTAQLLAAREDPFSTPREHRAAVLFADLVAFTTWSEQRSPGETIEVLRAVHGLVADIVFRHHGTLDKFIGDGVMATFGTPEPAPEDAANAVAAMVEISEAFAAWAQAAAGPKDPALRLAIGVHYGPVVIGNIGSKTRLEFAVLGDTVNVASRLEGATRAQGCCALASAALVRAAAQGAQPGTQAALARLRSHGALELRGRQHPIEVYAL